MGYKHQNIPFKEEGCPPDDIAFGTPRIEDIDCLVTEYFKETTEHKEKTRTYILIISIKILGNGYYSLVEV